MNQIDTQAFGRKSKKGSSTNAQNTLRSNTRARLLMVLSEGPISGLVNGAKSIYREQTPIQNPDDTFNFDNFYFEEHKGYPDDAPFSGNGAAGSIVSVEAQADFNTPVQRTVVEKDADALNVIVRVNSLFRVDKSKGTMQTNSVAYVIEVRAAGGTWETAVTNHLIDQKTMSPTQIAHRVELPLNGSPWDVRLRRLTADEVEEENQSDIYFESYVILVEGKFTMPHTAALQMEVNAEDIGGNIGTLAFHVKGRLIEVPSNYDPVTRAYTGIWDGTFKVAYCNCPPWIFRDLIVNDRFGLGEFVNTASVDKWALYNIARYCDGLVPSGYKDAQGNDIMEPRYTFNGVISGREEAFNVLRQMTATWRGMGYWSLGQMTATADMPEDPFCLVSPANVIDGDFNYSSTATKARYSVVLVRFSDPNDFYRDAVEPVINDEMLRRFGWREKTVTLKGCTSRSAAHRYGRWILDVDQYETETVTYRAGLDQLNVVPGRIVAITDPRKAEVRMGGRVVSQAETQITLDAPLEMTQGVSYTITWKTPAGTLMSRSVTSAAGAVLTVPAVPVADRAQANAMYALSSTEVNPRQYRVLGVTEVEPEIYQVTALFHDPQKYARVERGIVFDPPSYTKKREKPAAPTNLVVLETGTLTNTSQRSRLTLSWTPPLGTLVSGFMVEITSPDTGREALPITTSTQVDYPVVEPGVYSFSVKTVDILGQISNPATMQHTVLGDAGFGTSTVTDLALASGGTIFTGADVRLVWKNKFPTSMAPGAGDAVAVAETSPLYSHNMVKIMRADTLEVLRSVRVTTAGLTYDFEANKADNQVLGKAPARQLRFDVQAFDVHGAYSPANSIVVSNPVPAMVSPNVTSEGNVIRVTWKMPDEQDVTGTRVWIETNNTFDPDATTPKFDSTGSLFLFTGAATAVYYVRVGVYDGFSKQLLNVSAPIEISTGRVPLLDTDTPGTVTGLALSSVLGLNGKSKLIATWAASSATGLTGYDVEMRVSGGNWVSFTTSAIRYEWEVVSGTSYDVRVKARNYASRSGNYSTILTHVAAANTTPPAVPAGLTITPGFATFWLKWTANSEPDLAYYEIYESDVTTAPTDSTVATFTSTGSSFVRSGMGDNQTRHYWLRACRSTGPTSVVKSAWSARVQSTTTASVGVTTEALAGLVDATSFASSVKPVEVVNALPGTPHVQGRTVILTTDNKLYRNTGSGWTAAIPTTDLTGLVNNAQIASGLDATKVTTGILSSARISALEAAKITGKITETQIADNSISTPMLKAGSVQTEHLAAGAVTAEQLYVGAASPTLIPNPTAESGTTAGWALVEGASAGNTFSVSAGGYIGGKCFAISGAGGNVAYGTKAMPVVPGRSYIVRYAVKASAASSNGLYVRLAHAKDRPNTPSGDYVFGYLRTGFTDQVSNGAIDTNWIYGEKTWTAPTDVYWVSLTFYRWGNIGANTLFIDALDFRELVDGVLIKDGAVTANKIAVNTITSQQIAANAITASELASNSVTATHITAGNVTSDKLAANSVIAGKVAAGAISTDQLKANAITTQKMLLSGSNMIDNGSFATNDLTGWRPYTNPQNADVVSVVGAAKSLYALRFISTGVTVSAFSSDAAYSDTGALDASMRFEGGKRYRVTMEAYGTGSVSVLAYFHNKDGTYNSSRTAIPSVTLTETWIDYSGEFVAPTGTIGGHIYVYSPNLNGTQYFTSFTVKEMDAADLIVDGSLTSNMVGTNELIASTANIKDAIITDAKIANLSAAKLTAGTALAGSITVSGTALSTIQSQANDPAARINAASTKINPGQVLISGSTTLSSWQRGGDTTKIDGGAISANTIAANKLEIGSRNITLTGIVFDYNSPSTNRVSWTSGTIKYIDDAGVAQSRTISASSSTWSSGVLFLYWIKDSSTIYATTSQATALGANNVILATYEGGTKLDADYGRTIVDGGSIKTNSITATQIAASTITAAQIAASTITATQIAANAVTASQIAANAVTAVKISAGTITTDKLNASSFSASGLAVFGSAVKSTNFVSGSAGWSIYQNGSAEFNGVVISRPLQVDSGRVTSGSVSNIPSDTPTVLATYYVYATGVPLNAWSGANKSYNAEAGLSNTSVSTGNSANCYFGVVATVLPLTIFSGSQTLRLKLEIVVRNVNSINPASGGTFNIDWRIYEVT